MASDAIASQPMPSHCSRYHRIAADAIASQPMPSHRSPSHRSQCHRIASDAIASQLMPSHPGRCHCFAADAIASHPMRSHRIRCHRIAFDAIASHLMPSHRSRCHCIASDAIASQLGGVLVKIEMRRKAAASHTLLTRHLGECIPPPPQSPRGPPGTRPPTLQRQDFCFLDGWRAVGGPKVAQIHPQTTHRAQETHLTGPYTPQGLGRVPSARPCRSRRLGAPRRPRRH